MLSYGATIPLPTCGLIHLAGLLRTHRAVIGSRWRRRQPGEQALLVLAHLRSGDSSARLAAGFGISASTAWRYIREAVDVLAAEAPTLEQAMRRIGRLAYAVLDGTLIPIDQLFGTQDRAHYSGEHHRHDVNTQVIADPVGRLMWISPALAGMTHAIKPARTHGIAIKTSCTALTWCARQWCARQDSNLRP